MAQACLREQHESGSAAKLISPVATKALDAGVRKKIYFGAVK